MDRPTRHIYGRDILDLEFKSVEWTPLLATCHAGHVECAACLTQAGAIVETTDGDGRTRLKAACEKGHTEVVRLLLHHGAQVNSVDERGTVNRANPNKIVLK